ncbi:MAG TPA: phosphate ABC transporter permease subunit PstC [Polyangiaceae bacterium]|nr:phosphate ABC transporter permease subunit PstC [Polyangiaceae bacterium]
MSNVLVAQSVEQSRPVRLVGRPRPGEAIIRGLLVACGWFVLATTIAMLGFLARTGIRGLSEVGFGTIFASDTWKPEAGSFGGVALIVGTFATALGAIALGAAPAVLAAVWLTEFASDSVRRSYRRVMEVASAVPSVVYGWLALIYLVPIFERLAHLIKGEDAPVTGEGIAASAFLLAVMIAPTVLLLSLDALSRVPRPLRDASAALGASPWQTAFSVSVPYGWRGLLVAIFFGFARAAGETMAVQMVIGGARRLPRDFLFSPTTTISAQIVMDMQNARPGTPENDVLYSMALVLLTVSIAVVLVTRALARGQAQ